ncbi:MAG TPA: hypothetical protein VEK07_11710 [Polyangiaceae bacterium]|nr:hypothetical protein [Polyangiaceae bacterium]
MTEGNLELIEILAYWAVVVPAATAVLVRDERRLPPEQAARAWPPISRDAAIFSMWILGFNPACVLVLFAVHFVRTRGFAAGLDRALFWACAVVGPAIGVDLGLDALLGGAG